MLILKKIMINLNTSDIQAHEIVAKQLDRITLNSIISSIKSEYEEMKAKISPSEQANYQKLLNIYSEELMSRYTSQVYYSSSSVH